MRGFELNGLGVRSTVEQGCIANYDAFVVKRNGKVTFETQASIISLDGFQGSAASANHKVEFYFRDAADGTVAARRRINYSEIST